MNEFSLNLQIRWSDLDPNFHVVHSKYYDYGADCRMAFLIQNGLTPAVMQSNNIGPILFREECIFKREIRFEDAVTVSFKLDKISSDFSRWTMIHEIIKKDRTIAAIITAEGAWLNTATRKLTLPPQIVIDMFNDSPKTDTFSIVERKPK